MIFNTISELLEQAKKDNACSDGLNWALRQTFGTVFKDIPLIYRIWCLTKGYEQFEEDCPWVKINGNIWTWLLQYQPKYEKYCSWDKIKSENWYLLLAHQPQFKSFRKEV